MNPGKVNKMIRKFDEDGLSLCIDKLKKETGIKFSHRDLRFSTDVYFCDCCNGYRHMVNGMKAMGYIKCLFFHKKKIKTSGKNLQQNETQPENTTETEKEESVL